MISASGNSAQTKSATRQKKKSALAVVQAVASAAQAANAAATAVAQTSPSYVPPGSSSSSSSSKPSKSIAQEYIKGSKNPKSVSGKYAKESEKAQKKRERTKAKVEKKTAEVTKKYTTSKAKQIPFPKKGPSGAYEGIAAVNQVLRRVDPKGKSQPTTSTGRRQNASTGVSGPKPRKVANRLERAVKKAVPKAEVPSVVPKQWRDEVAKYGKMLDPVVPRGMTGSEYLGKMIQFESGWNPSAKNPSGATGLGQFMPYTRDTFKNEYGVDPYASPKQAIKAAAMHASGKYGHAPLYAGYNPGYSDTDPIPSVDGGKTISIGKGKPIPKPLKRTARQTLGKKPTEAILQGGKVIKDKSGKQKKLQVQELFYDPGISLDNNGQGLTKISPIGGHGDHVHVSSTDPRSMLKAIVIADRLGLRVSENPAVDTVDPVHASGSYHYRSEKVPKALKGLEQKAGGSGKTLGQAIDVSGDPAAMAQFDQIIAGRATGDSAPVSVPISGTNLAVKVPTPTTAGQAVAGGVSSAVSSGAVSAPVGSDQRKKKGQNVSRRLAAIDRWMTSPVTAPTPDISQELIDRILNK